MVLVIILPWFLRCSRLNSEDLRAGSSSQEREDTGIGMQHKLRTILASAKAAAIPSFSTGFLTQHPTT